MPITQEQVNNTINYFVMDPERDQIYLFLLTQQEFQDLSLYTKEQAVQFTKMLARSLASKQPGLDTSPRFIINLALAIQRYLKDVHNNNLFKLHKGAFELVQIIEKEKGLI